MSARSFWRIFFCGDVSPRDAVGTHRIRGLEKDEVPGMKDFTYPDREFAFLRGGRGAALQIHPGISAGNLCHTAKSITLESGANCHITHVLHDYQQARVSVRCLAAGASLLDST